MAFGNADNVDAATALLLCRIQWLFPGPRENGKRSTRAAEAKSDCYRIHQQRALLRYVSAVLSRATRSFVLRVSSARSAGFVLPARGKKGDLSARFFDGERRVPRNERSTRRFEATLLGNEGHC